MKVAIMQPTYLPWVGYLALIDSVEAFILYEDVQFEKHSWQHRNRIKDTKGKELWLTVPVHSTLDTDIRDVQIDNHTNWRKKHWESIRQSYSKTRYWYLYKEDLESIYSREWTNLNDLTSSTLLWLINKVGINPPIIWRSSDFHIPVSLRRVDRLVFLLQKLGATEYIAVQGSKGYLNPERSKLEELGIALTWFQYSLITYPQRGTNFVPSLSALDLLVNTGSYAKTYIREGLLSV